MRVGVRVPVTSLCPCSREISDYGAHNQRGYVEIDVTSWPTASPIWFEDLVDVAEGAASAPIYSLLKRADERHVTMRAYENPAFVEDIARDVVVALQADRASRRITPCASSTRRASTTTTPSRRSAGGGGVSPPTEHLGDHGLHRRQGAPDAAADDRRLRARPRARRGRHRAARVARAGRAALPGPAARPPHARRRGGARARPRVSISIVSAGYGLLGGRRSRSRPTSAPSRGCRSRAPAWAGRLSSASTVARSCSSAARRRDRAPGRRLLRRVRLDRRRPSAPRGRALRGTTALRMRAERGRARLALTTNDTRRFACGLVGLKGEVAGRLLARLADRPGDAWSSSTTSSTCSTRSKPGEPRRR